MTDEEKQDAFAGEDAGYSGTILGALKKAEGAFRDWQTTCTVIDEIYNREGDSTGLLGTLDRSEWQDAQLDLFWSSFEVMKPAVYARAPVPAVAPLFKDSDPVKDKTADVLERSATSVFALTDINEVMKLVRDDVIFTSRGVMWLSYESDGKQGGQKVCVEFLDRMDFLHEPARTWAEVGWVARRAWMTRKEMRERFSEHSGDAYENAQFKTQRDDDHSEGDKQTLTRKAGVWEVWHKADNKVYWVTEGVDKLLDSGAPHLKLSGFFPCPKPAYATLQRRSLIPSPDWLRYAVHFRKVSDLTSRIYLLLTQVRMMGIIGGGGDIADAVDEMMRSEDDQVIVRVNTIAGDINSLVAWMPLNEVAQAITGLIQARAQLIDDFYQLSGISDIMRGATESDETLGAQQLKSQYGSVRVREKVEELQRIAADAVRIACEIIAENFTQKTILELSQMQIPTRKEIEKRIKEIEDAAEKELKALGDKAKEAAQDAQEAPEGAEQAFQQAQQQVIQKYAPMLAEAQGQVAIEDVMKLLRDDHVRSFTFEIESDSTILTDEMQEKASRNEFMSQFTQAASGVMQIAAMGDEGAELAGEMLKFSLAPYRVGRQMEGVIERWVKAAPQYAAQAQGGEDQGALAEANKMLADAEQKKAQAAMAGVQAKAQLDQANAQLKFAQLQEQAATNQRKAEQENEKLRLQIADATTKAQQAEAKLAAEVDKLRAQTAEILAKIGLDVRKQDLEEYRAASDVEARQVDQAMAADRNERSDFESDRTAEMGERQQGFAEAQAMNGSDE